MATAKCAWASRLCRSHHVNGVSALHTDLMRKTVFHDCTRSIQDASTTDQRITFRVG